MSFYSEETWAVLSVLTGQIVFQNICKIKITFKQKLSLRLNIAEQVFFSACTFLSSRGEDWINRFAMHKLSIAQFKNSSLKETLSHCIFIPTVVTCSWRWKRSGQEHQRWKNAYIHTQRTQSLCRVGLGGGWFYLVIFNETGTDCSLHEVLKFQEWKRAYRMQTAISRSIHKSCTGERGSIVKTSVASNGQNQASELAVLRSNSSEFLFALAWRAVLLFLGWNECQY